MEKARMEKKRARKGVKEKVVVDNIDDGWGWLVNNGIGVAFLCIATFALLIRVATSLHSYSGAGNPPRFGDYEAQRHWMEITLNLPVREWYHNSTANDLSYWGLDYPPLTAYQSFFHGLFLRKFDPDSVSLFTSHGHESYLGKLLMRWTVLSSDALVFFPAVLWFILLYYNGRQSSCNSDIQWHMTMLLLSPCLILIDHGHFQYNCISLGLTLAAVGAILSQKDLFACVLFSLALNHKQMSAYFAPAFFSHLLGKCFRRRYPVLEVAKLGLMVLGTFVVIWWPYLHSTDTLFEVLSRLAPFERGIYEDYVANFWCTTSILIKWKRFTTQSLKLLSLAATVLTCLPSMVQQVLAPSNKGFLYGLLNCSLSFYMFSFQVHEKSILLPLLPASLLAMEFPRPFFLLTHYAMFSMFPLLCRDKLVLPYVALYALFVLVYLAPCGRRDGGKACGAASLTSLQFLATFFVYLSSVILHVIYLTIHPPKRYPYLFEAVIMLLCFSHFVLFAFYTNAKQWRLLSKLTSTEREKKLS